MRNVRRFLVAFGLTAFVACGGDSPGLTDPDPDPIDTTKQPPDTAAANASKRNTKTNEYLTQLNDALTAMGQSGGAGGAGGPQGFAVMSVVSGGTATLAAAPPPANAAACTFDEATTRWNCPDFTQTNGLVSKSWFQFLDAAGVPHKVVDTTKTAAIRRVVTLSGVLQQTIGTQQGPVAMNDTTLQSDTLMLSGLLGPKADRKAISTGMLRHVFAPVSGTGTIIRMGGPKTVEDFRFAPPLENGQPPATRYPISGKITLVWTTSQDAVPNSTATTTQVTSYDGTAIAKLVIRNLQGAIIKTCTYDMTNQNSPPICTP